MGPKTLPTIWGTYMKLVTKYQISAINSCWEKFDVNEHICSMCIKINKFGKQEVWIWWVQKCFPQYGIPIWSLWPNIRFLPSIVAEKNETKNGHIQNVCSMCIKINKVGKQEVGIWWVQKRLWGIYMKLVTKYQISAINSCWEKCDEKCAYMFNVYKN